MARIEGLTAVIRSMEAIQVRHQRGYERGLKMAGLHLQGLSQKLVPVEHGNLKASATTRMEVYGSFIVVYVGYTAKYAIWVHEDLEKAHGAQYNAKYAKEIAEDKRRKRKDKAYKVRWRNRGPNQQAKFLEQPLREHGPELAEIVWEETTYGNG